MMKRKGYEILTVKGWDYPALIETYEKASKIAREDHTPVLLHVQELTQPQGHSTSGSHERYKSEERLQWEREHDCNVKMREWMIEGNLATDEELQEIEKDIKKQVRDGKKAAWEAHVSPVKNSKKEMLEVLDKAASGSTNKTFILQLKKEIAENKEPLKKDLLATARKALRYLIGDNSEGRTALINWINKYAEEIQPQYSSHLYSDSQYNALNIEAVEPHMTPIPKKLTAGWFCVITSTRSSESILKPSFLVRIPARLVM